MTTLVHTESRGDYQLRTDKTLVSTAAFHNDFYTYTVPRNPATGVTTGVFTLVAGATATTCPTGRVLHMTGRKLYPDVNPMTTFVGGLTEKKFLVSVYDPISFLNGFVDPSSDKFNNFDQNLPNFFNLGRNGSGVEWPGGGKGEESAGGGLVLIDAGTQSPNVPGGGGTFNIGAATMGKVSMTGAGGGTCVVNGSAITVNSKIFVTMINNNATAYLSSQGAGTFTITLGNGGLANFLIINA
jgi:hypothetical protein